MSAALPPSVDVIVVGAGNAAFCAAMAAAESGVSVLMLERAPEEQRGGNSAFTGGENVLNLDSRTFFGAGITIYGKNVAFGNSELLPLGFNGRFHK